MLELYRHGSSVSAAKVRVVLAEKQLEWRGHYVDIRAGEQFTPAYQAINPKGLVPALTHDGRTLVESTVICEYLDEAFADQPLRPADPFARARMRMWTKLVDEEVHPAVRPVTYVSTHRHTIMRMTPDEVEQHINNDPHPVWRERKRGWIRQGFDAPDVKQAIQLFDRVIADMDAQLATTEWLAGDQYTLADAALTPYANRLDMLGFAEMWRERPHFARWFAAVKARPSFKPALFDYLPDDLAARMRADGRQAWPQFRAILAAAQ